MVDSSDATLPASNNAGAEAITLAKSSGRAIELSRAASSLPQDQSASVPHGRPWGALMIVLTANAVMTLLVIGSVKYGGAFWRDHWDDIGNVLGVVVSVAGFYWTIRIAKNAERAAKEARDNVFKFDAVVELSQALALMGDMQNFHRDQQWPLLPDRYRRVREKLVSLRNPSSSLTEDQRARITGVLEQLKDIDEKIEACLTSSKSEPSPPRPLVLLALVKSQADEISELLAELRQRRA